MKGNYEIKNLPISSIELNKGQIYGLPKNPRFIRDERFRALKKSIEDAPEMLGLRELLVYPHDGKYVVIGGNMRLRACQDLGYKEVPCKVLPEETPVAKLREYTIKDNEGFGQNDMSALANDWDTAELMDFGMANWELPSMPPTVPSADLEFAGGTERPSEDDAMAHTERGDTVYHGNGLPEELQGVNTAPEKLLPIEGRNETAVERVIITYPKEREHELAAILGLEGIQKVIYSLDEITVGASVRAETL